MNEFKFQPGDIGATEGRGVAGQFSKQLMDPQTDRFHFFLIWEYIPELNDYTIIESINIGLFAKGIAVGYLSKYKGRDVEIYRITDPEMAELGEYACWNVLHFEECRYDFGLIFRLMLSGIVCLGKQLLFEHRVRRIRPEELPYSRNDKFICSECANEGWWGLDYPIVPPGVPPIPASFKQAELVGRIKRDYKGDLSDIQLSP